MENTILRIVPTQTPAVFGMMVSCLSLKGVCANVVLTLIIQDPEILLSE